MARSKSQTRWNIEVTQEDIEKAHKSDSYNCVVAQAIARTIPDATRVDVDIQSIRFTRESTGERFLYLTPYTVQGYIVAFDAGDELHPFNFHIRDPKLMKRTLQTEAGKANQTLRKMKERGGKTRPAPAPEKLEAAESVKAAYEGAVKTKTTEGEISRVPRVHKKKQRSYGHRVLRVNQD